MKYFLFIYALVVISIVSIMGFRGTTFTEPPLELFPDMDAQSKYRPQGASAFFADGRGQLKDDEFLHFGKKGEAFAKGFPMPVTRELIDLGAAKYAIYCTPCHGGTGDGNGVTKFRGMAVTPTYHDDRLRDMPEGEIYNTVTNGIRLMGGYADKLSTEERWAVIAYMRVLQRAQNASVDDVPQANRKDLGL